VLLPLDLVLPFVLYEFLRLLALLPLFKVKSNLSEDIFVFLRNHCNEEVPWVIVIYFIVDDQLVLEDSLHCPLDRGRVLKVWPQQHKEVVISHQKHLVEAAFAGPQEAVLVPLLGWDGCDLLAHFPIGCHSKI